MLRCALASLLALGADCSRDVIRDSAELDRALIPAIELAAARDPLLARTAMDELVVEWQRFLERHRDDRPDEPVWRDWLDAVDTLVMDADELADSTGTLGTVAEYLIDVRMMLVELRDSVGLDYWTDGLHELDEPLDDLHRLALARDSASLDAADTGRLRELLLEAQAIREEIEQQEFDPGRYGFDAEQERRRDHSMERLGRTLEGLEAALDAGERRAILTAARTVRPDFLELYRLFGDWRELP